MTLRLRTLFIFIVFWSIIGYPFLVAITTPIGANNTVFSVTFRGLAAVLGALLIVVRFRTPDVVFWLLAMFWSAYHFRIYYTFHVLEETASRSATDFWIWSVGACMLPAFAAYLAYHHGGLLSAFRYFCVSVLIAIVSFLLFGDTLFVNSDGIVVDINRWNVDALNPISMGHVGVTGVLLGACLFLTRERTRLHRLIAFALIGLGLYLAILANSRGPIVAGLASLSVLALARSNSRSVLALAACGLISAAAMIADVNLLAAADGIVGRFTRIRTGNDLSTIGRSIAFEGALSQFLGSPIFGDGVQEKVTGYYPHNVTLEAFMATGLVGGLPYLALQVIALASALHVIRNGSGEIWVGMLAIQYMVGAQISGAIYQSSAMWASMMLVIVTARHVRRERGRRRVVFTLAGAKPNARYYARS